MYLYTVYGMEYITHIFVNIYHINNINIHSIDIMSYHMYIYIYTHMYTHIMVYRIYRYDDYIHNWIMTNSMIEITMASMEQDVYLWLEYARILPVEQ